VTAGPGLRIRVEGCRDAFAPRAGWVLGILAEALGRTAVFTDGPADVVYAPAPPDSGVWIPADPAAQAFFEGRTAFPGPRAHRAGGLALLFPARDEALPVPGDVVASAFHLLARWDEWCVPVRDRFDRLPYAESTFARVAGLDPQDPPVEGYVAALRRALGIPAPTAWSVYLTHDIDRLRRRTPRGLAGVARRSPGRALRTALGPDPWDNVPDVLWTSTRRGLAPTVYLIGRNLHRLDGTPRRVYERERADLARAVHAAGGEVGLHCSFAASEDPGALAGELRAFRAETGLPVPGVRYHYLRFRYHESVRWLEEAGVEYDASLGWAETPGFAAGIARPYHPWLMGEERAARLRLVPLAVMDTTLHSYLRLGPAEARDRALAVLGAVRAAGGGACLLWHNTYFADDRAPGYGALWEDLLDDLAARGASLGPVVPPAPAPPPSLGGRRVLHLTSVHRPRDVRILHKEAAGAARAGAEAEVLALRTPARRAHRLAAGWRLARLARGVDADLYHVHDPELLPAALWLARASGRPVVYDVHEYLGETVRTKRWLPGPVRRPLARVAAAAERTAAVRLDGVVGVNADLAARFAAAGARTAAAVTNAPWARDFPAPVPPEGPTVLYVGGLGPLRGLEVMRQAFALVRTPGARLVLAGPGEPGDLPPGAEHVGVVDHSVVAGMLARAAVAWIPLQRHGNYERAVPTKLVEAMAAGRPVVASDMGRMAGIVRAAGCGILVPPDDPPAHAAAIDRLLGDPGEAAAMGAAGRAAFVDGLAFEVQADRLARFYADVLGAR
jgi:glycosyltransferase involved in cell wall biosynthesis